MLQLPQAEEGGGTGTGGASHAARCIMIHPANHSYLQRVDSTIKGMVLFGVPESLGTSFTSLEQKNGRTRLLGSPSHQESLSFCSRHCLCWGTPFLPSIAGSNSQRTSKRVSRRPLPPHENPKATGIEEELIRTESLFRSRCSPFVQILLMGVRYWILTQPEPGFRKGGPSARRFGAAPIPRTSNGQMEHPARTISEPRWLTWLTWLTCPVTRFVVKDQEEACMVIEYHPPRKQQHLERSTDVAQRIPMNWK